MRSGVGSPFVFGEMGVALCAFLLCSPEVRVAANSPLAFLSVGASRVMAVALRAWLPRHPPPLELVAGGCAIYGLTCGLLGRTLLRKELSTVT